MPFPTRTAPRRPVGGGGAAFPISADTGLARGLGDGLDPDSSIDCGAIRPDGAHGAGVRQSTHTDSPVRSDHASGHSTLLDFTSQHAFVGLACEATSASAPGSGQDQI